MYTNPHTGLPMHVQQPQQQPMTPQQQQWFQQQQWAMQQQQMQGQQPQMSPQQQQWFMQQQMQRQQQQFGQQQFPQQGQHGQQFGQPFGQQQFGQQFNQQQQMGNQGVTGRFGQPDYGHQNPNNNQAPLNRFGSGESNMAQQPPKFQPAQQPQVVQPEPTVVSNNSLIVTPVKHKRSVTSKLTFATNVHSITEKDVNLDSLDEPYIMEDSIPALHAFLTEKVYKDDFRLKTLNVFAAICRNTFADKTLITVIDNLLSLSLEEFYREFRKVYENVETRYAHSVLEYLDYRLTLETNEYLTISSKTGVTIDSFASDFNDLIKLLDENDEKLKDAYLDNMAEFLDTLRAGKDILNSLESDSEQEDEPDVKCSTISEILTIAYLDRHVLETGLEDVGVELTKIEKHPNNLFVLSIVELLVEKKSVTFNLMTVDGSVFYVTHSEQSEVYIKRV